LSPQVLDLVLFGVAILVAGGIIVSIIAVRRARYARFRRRYERLHPLASRPQSMASRVVDKILTREHRLETDRILANITHERCYSIYTTSFLLTGGVWLGTSLLLGIVYNLPAALLALLILATPLVTILGGASLFRSSIHGQASRVRKLMGQSLPNILSLLKLEIAESTDPVTALQRLVDVYGHFISPQGQALFATWLARAQNEDLGSVLVSEGERFELREIVMLGKAFEQGAKGMALTAVLEKQIAMNSEISTYELLRSIHQRTDKMVILAMPAMLSMFVVAIVSVIAIGGGLSTFTKII